MSPQTKSIYASCGFTLAELLISLAILGVIATFTIPKILSSQQNGSFNAKGKEAAAMISDAYTLYKQSNVVTANTKPSDLTPYMNYVAYDTSSVIDHLPTGGSFACKASEPCLRLHNGAILLFYNPARMGGTASNNAMLFYIDPDGVYSGTTNGPGKMLEIALYYNGQIRTRGTLMNPTISGDGSRVPDATFEPTWFSWN